MPIFAQDVVRRLPSSPLWSPTATYAPNQVAVYNGASYVCVAPIVAPTVVDYHATILAASPAAYWPLTESGTTVGSVYADNSGHGHDVTVRDGHLTHAAGPVASTTAPFMPDTPNYDALTAAGITGLPVDLQAYTIEGWLYPQKLGTFMQWLTYGGASPSKFIGSDFKNTATPNPPFNTHNTLETDSPTNFSFVDDFDTIVNNGWHHLVISDDAAGNVRFYLDGGLIFWQKDAGISNGVVDNVGSQIWIGDDGNGRAGEPYVGGIAQVAIYAAVLSPAQVKAHYGAATGPANPPPQMDPVHWAPLAGYQVAPPKDATRALLQMGGAPFDGSSVGYFATPRQRLDQHISESPNHEMQRGSYIGINSIDTGKSAYVLSYQLQGSTLLSIDGNGSIRSSGDLSLADDKVYINHDPESGNLSGLYQATIVNVLFSNNAGQTLTINPQSGLTYQTNLGVGAIDGGQTYGLSVQTLGLPSASANVLAKDANTVAFTCNASPFDATNWTSTSSGGGGASAIVMDLTGAITVKTFGPGPFFGPSAGTNAITVSNTGVVAVPVSLSAGAITGPIASASVLGVVKVGSGLAVAGDGTLSAGATTAASVHVHQSANQSLAPNPSGVLFTFNTVDWDQGTATAQFSAGSNTRLTCQSAGIYNVTGTVTWASTTAGSYRVAYIFLNGGLLTTDIVPPLSTANSVVQTVTTEQKLAVGDYIELLGAHDAGTNINASAVFAMTKFGS